ncbi:MAG: NUDIX domain-containing protein [Mycobacterium sp.]|nr:NUDIX domain-containing protein [Mycobacterium sp.]
MPKFSAGILLHRAGDVGTEVLIGHPGGPFWARKDDGAWSIPKGEYAPGGDPWVAAQREFAEEIGCPVPPGLRTDLGSVRQPGGKILTVFAVQAGLDIAEFRSNTFTLEWPRGSGRMREFPELDRADWFPVAQARVKLLVGQRTFLDRLLGGADLTTRHH